MRTDLASPPDPQGSARRGVRGWLAAALLLLFGAGCAGPPSSGRYVLAEDPGSRYGFEFVQDRETGRWVQRACELRVSAERVLPDPLNDPEHGSLMHVDLLKPGSIEGAGIRTLDPDLRDGYRLWYITQVLGEHDLAGTVDYGIQVKWPETGQETRFELLEIIHPPALTAVPLDEWSGWIEPSRYREGGFAGIEEVSGQESSGGEVALPAHPFALRCKLFLVDTPGFVP
jgi:hypothetical protein